jgi:hypothetical protein
MGGGAHEMRAAACMEAGVVAHVEVSGRQHARRRGQQRVLRRRIGAVLEWIGGAHEL